MFIKGEVTQSPPRNELKVKLWDDVTELTKLSQEKPHHGVCHGGENRDNST